MKRTSVVALIAGMMLVGLFGQGSRIFGAQHGDFKPFVPNEQVDQTIVSNDDIGVYVFSDVFEERHPSTSNPAQYHLDHPRVAGCAYWLAWEEVEPEEGKFQWEAFDNMIAAARKVNKRVVLRLVNLELRKNTPAWVYAAGARHEVRYDREGKPSKFPIYWDPVFLEKWGNLIRTFGARYNGNPTVHSVGITGCGAQEEIHVVPHMSDPRNMALLEKFKIEHGYTNEKIVQAWKKVVDVYMEAFPDTRMNMDVHVPTSPTDQEACRSMDSFYQHLMDTYGMRCVLQRMALGENKGLSDKAYHTRIYKKYKDNTQLAYQGVIPGKSANRWKAYEIGLAHQMSFFEVYSSEFSDSEPASARGRWTLQADLDEQLTFLARYLGYQVILQEVKLKSDSSVAFQWYNRGCAPLKREKRVGKKGEVDSYAVHMKILQNGSSVYDAVHTPPIATNEWYANRTVQYEQKINASLKKGDVYQIRVAVVDPEDHKKAISLVNGLESRKHRIWQKDVSVE